MFESLPAGGGLEKIRLIREAQQLALQTPIHRQIAIPERLTLDVRRLSAIKDRRYDVRGEVV